MGVVVSMLRGVNVGGHHKIKMDALRALCEALGLDTPRTFVQSGNVVFGTKEHDLVRLASRIGDAVEETFGFRPGVILRTTSEMQDVVAGNPFAERAGVDPGKLIVMFLAADPGSDAGEKILKFNAGPEELRLRGREVYIYFPNGMGRSKLSPAAIEKTLKTAGTGRNWNTVTSLADLAKSLEA